MGEEGQTSREKQRGPTGSRWEIMATRLGRKQWSDTLNMDQQDLLEHGRMRGLRVPLCFSAQETGKMESLSPNGKTGGAGWGI
jgi:hypothetical protein